MDKSGTVGVGRPNMLILVLIVLLIISLCITNGYLFSIKELRQGVTTDHAKLKQGTAVSLLRPIVKTRTIAQINPLGEILSYHAHLTAIKFEII